MSDCNLDLIERDEDGNIKKVFKKDGQTESDLYRAIMATPILLSKKEGVSIFNNISFDKDNLLKGNTKDSFKPVKVDMSVINSNTSSEVKRVKDETFVNDTGQTFNLDGTTYSDGGLVVPIASINTTQDELTPEMLSKFIDDNKGKLLNEESVKFGIYKFDNSDVVAIDLNILVPLENTDVAVQFARIAGQESIYNLTNWKTEYTGANGLNTETYTDQQFRDIATALRDNRLPEFIKDGIKVDPIKADNSYNFSNLTEDGEGNFVFYHYGDKGYGKIKRGTGQNSMTSRSEAEALRKVGGLAMYYTTPNMREQGIGGKGGGYMVKVPKDKVYDFNNDFLGLRDLGKFMHSKEHKGKAYDTNTSLAYVTKIAGQNGYEMVVSEWGNGRTRAQSIKELTPMDTNLRDGNVVTKPFKNNYKDNAELGYEMVIPKSKDELLQEFYNKVERIRNREGRYDAIYDLRVSTEREKKYSSQDQITDVINKSDLSDEIKKEYQDILDMEIENPYSRKKQDTKFSLSSQEENGMTEDISDAVDKVTKTLSEVAPDVEIVVLSNEEYKKKASELGSEIPDGYISRGMYSGNQIIINGDYADATTVFHEAAHAILDKSLGNSNIKQVTDNFIESLERTLEGDPLLDEVKDFIEAYKNNDSQSEEAVVQIIALLAENKDSIQPKTKSVIRRFLESIAEILGIEIENSDQDIINFLNTVAGKLSEGDVLSNSDLNNSLTAVGTITLQDSDSSQTDDTVHNQLIKELDFNRFPLNDNTKLEKDVSVSKFAGKSAYVFESDRMVGAETTVGGNLYKFFGGIYYPMITGKWWASASEDKVKQQAGSANSSRDKDGYIYGVPVLNKPGSHLSNQNMFDLAWDFIKSDILNKKTKLKKDKLFAKIQKSLDTTSFKKGRGKEILKKINMKKSDSIKTLVSKLNDVLTDPNYTTFDQRKAFVSSMLGDSKKLDSDFPTAGTITSFASLFTEPDTNIADDRTGNVVTVMRTKGNISWVKSDPKDPFYHKSYPYEMVSDQPIEVYMLDKSSKIWDIMPVLYKKEGGIVSWDDARKKYDKVSRVQTESQFTRTSAKLSYAKGSITPETVENTNKVDFLTEDFVNVTYKVKGDDTEYTTYYNALNNIKDEAFIQVSLNDGKGNYMNIMTVEANMDMSTKQGVVNRLIKEGLVDENRTEEGGFLPTESLSGSRSVSEVIVEDLITENLGEGSFTKNSDGSYTITESTLDTITTYNKKGEKVEYKFSDIQKLKTFKELESKFQNPVMAATFILSRETKIKDSADTVEATEAYDLEFTENDLKQALLDFLGSIGVSVTSISDYIERYNAKNGVDPSAKALADIANRVVAFRNGEINLDDLTEETAHFIVEGWDQSEIEPLLEQVMFTDEWLEYADQYRKVYSKKYPKELVEDAVKKEILGKILAKNLKDKFAKASLQETSEQQKDFLSSILGLFTKFIQNINEFIRPDANKTLEDFSKKVEMLLMKDQLEGNISKDNISNSKFVLYSISNSGNVKLDKIMNSSKQLVYNLTQNINSLKEVLATTRLDRNTAKSIDKDLDRVMDSYEDEQTYNSLSDKEKQLLEAETLNGLARVLVLAENQTNYIKRSIESKGKLNQEESIVHQNLRNDIQPIIDTLRLNIDPLLGQDYSTLKDQAEEIYLNIGTVGAVVDSIDNDVIEQLIEDVKERFPNASEEYEDQIRQWAKVAQKDSTKFHATFGQLMHSNDPLLGMLNYIIEDINWESKDESTQNFKEFVQRLKDEGIVDANGLGDKITDYGKMLLSPWDITARDKDMRIGKLQILKDVLGLDESLDDIELIQKQRDPNSESYKKILNMTREQDTIIKRRNTELNQALNEQRYNKEFYEERNKRYAELDVTGDTIDFINSLSSSRAPLLAKATVEVDGVSTIDMTKLTAFEREQFRAISKNRSDSKTLHDKTGDLKKGILVSSIRPSSDIDYIEQDGLFYTLDPTVKTVLGSTKIAWDLNRLDQEFFKPNFGYTVSNTAPTSPEAVYVKGKGGMYYTLDLDSSSETSTVFERSLVEPSEGDYVRDGKYYYKLTEQVSKPNTLSETFFKSLKDVFDNEGLIGVQSFLTNNTTFNFKDSYWDELLGGSPSMKSKFKSLVKDMSTNVSTQDSLDEYKRNKVLLERVLSNTQALKGIIKMYKNPNIPTESLSDAIPSVIKSSIDSLEDSLREDYRSIKRVLDDNNMLDEVQDELDPISETTLNSTVQKAFDAIVAKGGKTLEEMQLDFLESMLSKESQGSLATLSNSLDYGTNNYQFNSFLKTIDSENMTKQEILVQYAAFKLPSYYKKYAPLGYDNAVNELSDLTSIGNRVSKYEDVKDLIENNPLLDVTPNYSFNEERAQQELNPDYDTNFEGGSAQPKLSKYRNKEFFRLFGDKKDSNGNYVATKNQKLFNTIEIFKDYQRETLSNLNEEGANIYRLPQMSKTNQEKFAGLFSKEGNLRDKLKEVYLDVSKYRADDLIQGQRVSGRQVIPKYYLNDVDGGIDDLSLDVMSTYYLMSKEASLHKARRKHIGKAVALQDKIKNRRYKDGRVSSESNTAGMAKSFIDSSFFGIKESVMYKTKILGYEVDLAKIARQALNIIKFRNLGLNLIIPATSYLTAETNTFIERLIGERVHKSSYNKAISEFGRLAGDAMTETGKDYTEAPLNVLGEFFGIFDAEDRLKNSVQGKFWKNLPKIGSMMHSVGNFPIIPRIMLSTLYDFRFTNDGKVMNFTEFKRLNMMNGVTDKKAIEQEWKALSDRNIYDHLDISKTNVTLDMDKVKQTLGTNDINEEYINKKMMDVKKFVSRNVSDIDGQIPNDKRIAAQRNFMLNYVMTHKSWLSIATSNRTKSRHFNTSTGLYEEGNYASMYRVFGKIIQETRQQGLPKIMKAMKTVWDNADEVERLSIKRTTVDFVAFSALGFIASALMGYAEEEENQDSWGLQLANLLMLRTLNETGSSTLGLHNSFFDTADNVFVGLDLIKTFLSFNHYFDDKEITRGIYKGKTVRERQMIKLMPGAKQALDLSQLDVTTKTFLQFNEDNIAITPSLNYYLFDKDK